MILGFFSWGCGNGSVKTLLTMLLPAAALASNPASESAYRQFLTVEGQALTGETVSLPAQFTKAHNVVIVVYQGWQQEIVDTWLPTLEVLEDSRTDVAVFELPTIREINSLARWWIYRGCARVSRPSGPGSAR